MVCLMLLFTVIPSNYLEKKPVVTQTLSSKLKSKAMLIVIPMVVVNTLLFTHGISW